MFAALLKYIGGIILLVIVASYFGFNLDPAMIVDWTADKIKWVIDMVMPYAQDASDQVIEQVDEIQENQVQDATGTSAQN